MRNDRTATLLVNALIRDDCDSLLIRDGRIDWVGRGVPPEHRNAQVVDLEGRRVLPGFHDNHVHALILGDHADRPDLTGKSEEEIRVVVRRELRRAPETTSPLLAFGWDYPSWPTPHRRVLDDIAEDRPVALFQFSGHGACVNSAMLRKLRITSTTPDPPGGVIIRDSDGEPTGVLRDAAVNRIHQQHMVRLNMSPRKMRERFRKAFEIFSRNGITSVGDNTWFPPSVWTLTGMRRRGELPCRVQSWPYGAVRVLAHAMKAARYDPIWVRQGPWKYFLDGAFSTHTAWLSEPYADEPQSTGTPVLHGAALQQILDRHARRAVPAAFHAIGDGAVHEFLNSVATSTEAYGEAVRNVRLRLEHVQLVRPDDVGRFERLGVLVAAQPHAISSFEKDAKLLGASRARRAYPYRSLIDAGAALSFGSDAPAEPTLSPLRGIHNAVNRDGNERISVAEAIDCYTRGSAYAEGSETVKGTIEIGKLADLVVLSDDPYTIPAENIKDISVDMTICDGQIVYSRGGIFEVS